MALSSIQLEAFARVAQEGNFSRAAESLHITQSALSQRVLNLEKELGATLLVREPLKIRLTKVGEALLRYYMSKEALEDEFFRNYQGVNQAIGGTLRIGGFSTLVRSVVLPTLAEFVKKREQVHLEIFSKEMKELPKLLENGEVDYLFLNRPLEKEGIENVFIGYEENVLIRSVKSRGRDGVFLDHDVDDTTTEEFWRLQGKKVPKFKRSYLDEIYAIIDGVRLGLGQAIAPKHLVGSISGVEIVGGYKKLKIPIYLNFYTQAFYTDLHKTAIAFLQKELPSKLSST